MNDCYPMTCPKDCGCPDRYCKAADDNMLAYEGLISENATMRTKLEALNKLAAYVSELFHSSCNHRIAIADLLAAIVDKSNPTTIIRTKKPNE